MKRCSNGKYYLVYLPQHHRANTSGCVYEHVLIAEQMLGRDLLDAEVVHHKDFNGLNNDESNIMVFASKSDHAKYHYYLKHHYEYDIQKFDGVYHVYGTDKKIVLVNRCRICGKSISNVSKLCKQCYDNNRPCTPNRPDAKTLSELLNKYSYSEIGRKYGVSPNAVKRWAKKYDLYTCCFHSLPDRDILEIELNTYSIKVVSDKYNVDPNIITAWIKKMQIVIQPEMIQCVETKQCFKSAADVIRYLEPDIKNANSIRCRARKLRQIIGCDETFDNYHWIILNKKWNRSDVTGIDSCST